MTIIRTSRSAMDTALRCRRERLLIYEHNWERNALSLPLVDGIYLHRGLALSMSGLVVEDFIDELRRDYTHEVTSRGFVGMDDLDFTIAEQLTLLEGLLRCFELELRDRLLEKGEVIAIEKEFEVELAPGLVQQMRADVIQRRHSDGMIIIPDFKSTSISDDRFSQRYLHNNQVVSYARAVEQTLGERVAGVGIIGLMKGSYAVETAMSSPFHGRRTQRSPLCYGYQKPEEPIQLDYTSRKGFVKIASWEQMTIKEWVSAVMTPEDRQGLFIELPEVNPDPVEMREWTQEMVHQELEISAGAKALKETPERKTELLSAYFPRNRDSCYRFGSRCPVYELCWDPTVAEDPAGSGLFRQREDHHFVGVKDEGKD